MRSAFSLVELSIVLVILGLLVGGVLSGQSLIHAAELRSVTQEFQKYAAAGKTFRDKYFFVPGDMSNATQFWGIAGGATGTDATCRDATVTTKTCNGNGDGKVANPQPTVYEDARFWQHLALAGLIEGAYNGTYQAPTWGSVIGGNVAPSRIAQNLWYAYSQDTAAGTAGQFAQSASNYFWYGSVSTPFTPLTPEDAWNVDTKMDDGKPGTGAILGDKGTVALPCSSAVGVVPPGDANATYNVASTIKGCSLFVKNAF